MTFSEQENKQKNLEIKRNLAEFHCRKKTLQRHV